MMEKNKIKCISPRTLNDGNFLFVFLLIFINYDDQPKTFHFRDEFLWICSKIDISIKKFKI